MSVGGPAAPGTEDPLLGRVLSERYRILRKLGEGGMGVVYLAEHVVIEKKLALKVLFPDLTRRADLIQRFMQEAKSASRIGHENVIDITDFGQSPEGYVFIAMEYLSGQDLGQVLKASGLLSWQRAQPIVVQIVKALRAAHERGIIHRDMKPENIFVTPRDDGREFVKVLDFGIAKVMGLDEDVPRLTRTGMIFGTPEYMSPEQAQGQSVDHRVDIYAVGCIMFHILTGQVPFKADSFMGILSKHMMEAPEPPRSLNPTIDPAIEAIILRAMEKDPAKRFQSMRELLQALLPAPSAELSGAVPVSPGLSSPRTAVASAPSAAGAAPVAQPPSQTPVARGTTASAAAPLPFATHELEGRASIPLAAANPEVRRSKTETFSRVDGPVVDGPRQRAPAGKAGLIALAAGALVAVVAGVGLLRGRPAGAPPAAASAPSVAPAPPLVPPATAPAAAAASSGTGPEATPKPDLEAAQVNVTSANARGAKTMEGKPAERKSAHRRRSSREAVDALRVPEAADTPAAKPAIRTPAELKNPFVH
jgi:serine/threonine protein kinase